ncbi:MAG: sirohydrochlorin chelatase [Rhodospirillaceae bacterium]|nr:sirohydrochlorin chelatase [Rhodospirillaceae bacterium]MDP6645609.1 sirohydrochlorin chelatase [Rhodospirillales bacterium]
MSKTGVMICGHGSRDDKAVAEFAALQARLAERFPEYPVEYGFLEFARPIIRTGLDRLVEQGVDHILAVAGMLLSAGHVKNDIASVLNQYQADHPDPDFKIEYARPLDIDAKMMYAAEARIREAIEKAPTGVPLEETLLMVVGRGTSDPDANGSIAKICRMLWEGIGLGWGEVCYSGVTFPLVAPGLEHAARLGYRRIVVFPYFLFTGILVNRIYDVTDQIAERFPDIEFLKAGYLNDHPKVIDTFEARVRGIQTGDNAMNCQLCKYREQVVGFEAHHGLPQMSHHHHVEGIGTGQQHDHDDGNDHAHHHAPHPHPEHPHGPGKRNPQAVD